MNDGIPIELWVLMWQIYLPPRHVLCVPKFERWRIDKNGALVPCDGSPEGKMLPHARELWRLGLVNATVTEEFVRLGPTDKGQAVYDEVVSGRMAIEIGGIIFRPFVTRSHDPATTESFVRFVGRR